MNSKNIHVLSRAVIIDADHILLCKTLDLKINFCFLPGGHVEYGESVEETLVRELLEEAGTEIKVKRFLGSMEYSFDPGHNSICHNHEYTFFFEADSKILKLGNNINKLEDHIDFVWIPYDRINEIDLRPEPIKMLLPKWIATKNEDSFYSEMV